VCECVLSRRNYLFERAEDEPEKSVIHPFHVRYHKHPTKIVPKVVHISVYVHKYYTVCIHSSTWESVYLKR